MTDADISEEDGYALSDWEPRENVKPRFYIPSEPSSALLDGANITEDSCHIAEEDGYASEPSSALLHGTNIADNVDPFANEGLACIDPNRQFKLDTHRMKSQQSVCVILKGFPYSTTETDIQVRLRELGVQPDRIVICMDEHQHSRRFGFVTFPNVEVASQLVDTHFPGIQWPVPGGVNNTIEVLIDYSTPSKRPSKRHHKLDSDMEPHILKKQCDCGINYPSEERLANHLTKSSHKVIHTISSLSVMIHLKLTTIFSCYQEKVESNNSKGKARDKKLHLVVPRVD
ncbi:hypothetical protein PSHT_16317, partial [Puccinia striiformis]